MQKILIYLNINICMSQCLSEHLVLFFYLDRKINWKKMYMSEKVILILEDVLQFANSSSNLLICTFCPPIWEKNVFILNAMISVFQIVPKFGLHSVYRAHLTEELEAWPSRIYIAVRGENKIKFSNVELTMHMGVPKTYIHIFRCVSISQIHPVCHWLSEWVSK